MLTSGKKISIVAGNQAILRCPVKSNPPAKIQWMTPVVLQGETLNINAVRMSDGGQYSCRGENFLGVADAFLQVEVMSKYIEVRT